MPGMNRSFFASALGCASILVIIAAGDPRPAQANRNFALMNCDRQKAACENKCKPAIKMTPSKSPDGGMTPKLDGSKAQDCKLKCIDLDNKCRAKANDMPLPCTRTTQCAADETCSRGSCQKI